MRDLIPLPEKADSDGIPYPTPYDWHWPRSAAYEVAAQAALPEGWELYSTMIDTSPADVRAIWARLAGKDFGARRVDCKGYAFGVRDADGSPKHLRASLPGRPGVAPIEMVFPAGDLHDAARWVDNQIARGGR